MGFSCCVWCALAFVGDVDGRVPNFFLALFTHICVPNPYQPPYCCSVGVMSFDADDKTGLGFFCRDGCVCGLRHLGCLFGAKDHNNRRRGFTGVKADISKDLGVNFHRFFGDRCRYN